jgi:hypothetical protein
MNVKFKQRSVVTVFMAFLWSVSCYAQPSHFTKSDHWKTQKHELLFGVGVSNFLGDLGGLDRIGTHFSPIDMEWNTTRPSGHIGYRRRLGSMIATKTLLQYAVLKGDDALTNEPARRNRNLSFRTHLFEASQHIEFLLFRNEHFGKRYDIPDLKGDRNKNTVFYLFTGITVFGYIPQGPIEGSWTNLRPLNTEGQGLPDGGDPYSFISLGIPMGVGFKYGIDRLWRVSVELSYTQTFTDYLDDVSGVYYDNQAIRDAYGATAAYFADPSSGVFQTWTDPGELRGDASHNDGYIFANISIVRNITGKRARKLKWKYRF